jgi:hypothetical protein
LEGGVRGNLGHKKIGVANVTPSMGNLGYMLIVSKKTNNVKYSLIQNIDTARSNKANHLLMPYKS